MRSIGDLSLLLFSQRSQSALKGIVDKSARAMSTGQVTNKANHLGGATISLSLIDRKDTLLKQQKIGIAEAAIFAEATQISLGRIQDEVERTSRSLMLSSQIEEPLELRTLSERAFDGFDAVIQHLNTQTSGKFVFSGTSTTSRPLQRGEDMIANMRSNLAAVSSAGDLITTITAWFQPPGGSFDTTAYSGSSMGYVSMPLTAESSATFGFRADDDVVRDMLKALAIAALATDDSVAIPIDEKKTALEYASRELNKSVGNLIDERSSLGLTQARIDEARRHVETDLLNLETTRIELIGIDQFEEATRFEAAQHQLEILYRIAARQGTTSLAEYLR